MNPVPRTVLVTGAPGLIGQATVRYLADRGATVRALGRTADEIAAAAPGWSDAVVPLVGDARDADVVADALAGCDAVVHLAAIPHPSLGSAREVFTNNVDATFTVLAAAADAGVRRAVIASSIHAYGGALNPAAPAPAYFPLDEDLPTDIGDAYSLSKQVDELAARMTARAWGLSVVALRFPLVKTREELSRIAAEVARDPAPMMATGWAYLQLDDAAEAVAVALVTPVTGAHVVGLSASDTLVAIPTADLLAAHAPEVPLRRPVTGYQSLVDTSRAQALLGLAPGRSIHPRRDGRP